MFIEFMFDGGLYFVVFVIDIDLKENIFYWILFGFDYDNNFTYGLRSLRS